MLKPKTPAIPPIKLEASSWQLKCQLKDNKSKYFHQNKYCRNFQYCLHKYKLETFRNLLNEIRQIVYSFIAKDKVQRKYKIVYSNDFIIRIRKIFMISKKSNASDTHKLRLNIPDKMDLQRVDKLVASSDFSIYYTWKNIKKSHNRTNIRWLIWTVTWILPCATH